MVTAVYVSLSLSFLTIRNDNNTFLAKNKVLVHKHHFEEKLLK